VTQETRYISRVYPLSTTLKLLSGNLPLAGLLLRLART
jgi:hypothetical protein